MATPTPTPTLPWRAIERESVCEREGKSVREREQEDHKETTRDPKRKTHQSAEANNKKKWLSRTGVFVCVCEREREKEGYIDAKRERERVGAW